MGLRRYGYGTDKVVWLRNVLSFLVVVCAEPSALSVSNKVISERMRSRPSRSQDSGRVPIRVSGSCLGRGMEGPCKPNPQYGVETRTRRCAARASMIVCRRYLSGFGGAQTGGRADGLVGASK